MPRPIAVAIPLVIAALVLGCASAPSGSAPLGQPTAGATAAAFPGTPSPPTAPSMPAPWVPPSDTVARCEDVPPAMAPPHRYRTEPVYVANEQPTEELREWAQRHRGFEGIWLDREHNGWVTLAFSQDAAARQRDLEQAFPDVGVVAVAVGWTRRELAALRAEVEAAFLGGLVTSLGTSEMHGVVRAGIGAMTPEGIAAVAERFAGRRVCVDGIDPADLPAPGPQRAGGDGWRLLATEPTGHTYRTGIAFDAASLRALWALAGVRAPVPDVDWQAEVVIWFGAVYGSSCPELRLDDVEVVTGTGQRIVHAEIVVLDAADGCTDDANPRAFLVALERARLPAAPFAIQLAASGPPRGAPEERTLVDADLRVPGSVAEPDQVHGDLALPGRAFVESGSVIEPGFPASYRMSVHCGVEWLGELNGIHWRTAVPDGVVDHVPAAWRQVVAMDQSIILEVLLSEGPAPTVVATTNGHTIVYRPDQGPAPGCD